MTDSIDFPIGNRYANNTLKGKSTNGLRGGFSNSQMGRGEGSPILPMAERRLLQLNSGIRQFNLAILIERFWISQAPSSYEVEWVESVQRKTKNRMGQDAKHGFVRRPYEKFEENTKNRS